MKHTQEGIRHSRQPAGQVEGEQQEGRGRRKGKKHLGLGEKPQRHAFVPDAQTGMALNVLLVAFQKNVSTRMSGPFGEPIDSD
jgi:hypothetical protein